MLGASGRTRRGIAAAQAALVAVGAVIAGIPAGLGLAALVLRFQAMQGGGRPVPSFVVPWVPLVVLAIALPLVVATAAAANSVGTRSSCR